ncbi:MAG: hypothetical protein IH790_02090 [Acidobacteria bacterium]|nr:hypothetical protein [Acidobacteriota bacterium]
MNLDKNYRLISDDYNFILQKKLPMRNKKRAQRSRGWKNIGYWKDVGQALQAHARGVARSKLPNTLTSFSRLSTL